MENCLSSWKQIGPYVVMDWQKCGNIKFRIPMFCLRKTVNFKGLLPVNQSIRKNKKFSMLQIYFGTWYKKPFVDISYNLWVIMLSRVGCIKKAATSKLEPFRVQLKALYWKKYQLTFCWNSQVFTYNSDSIMNMH